MRLSPRILHENASRVRSPASPTINIVVPTVRWRPPTAGRPPTTDCSLGALTEQPKAGCLVGACDYRRSMREPPGVISVRLAMSLDGYIADHDGGYDWIVPVPSPMLDTGHQLPFDDFLADIDVVVMGRHCYEQGQSQDYISLGKQVIVATSITPASGPEGIQFCDDVVNAVTAARDRGNRCFLFGGGVLVHSFLAADAVDMLTVGIVPVLLGGGRPLFPGEHPTINLRLTDYTVRDGKVRLVYQRR